MERKWKKALMVEGDAWGYAIAEGRKDRCEARVRVKETVGARQIVGERARVSAVIVGAVSGIEGAGGKRSRRRGKGER